MRKTLTRIALLTLALAPSAAAPAAAQRAGAREAAGVVNSVIQYRLYLLGDSTRFDACRVFEAVGRPADFPAPVLAGVRRFLDREGARPCAAPAPPREGRRGPVVAVDSVRVRGGTARAYLTVTKGENVRREDYTLARRDPGAWEVREVRLWGHRRVYRAPDRPTGVPGSRPPASPADSARARPR